MHASNTVGPVAAGANEPRRPPDEARIEQQRELAGFGRRGDVKMHRVGRPMHVALQERAALTFLRHEPLELRGGTEALAKVQRAAVLSMVQQRVVGQC